MFWPNLTTPPLFTLGVYTKVNRYPSRATSGVQMQSIRSLLNCLDRLLWPHLRHDLGQRLGEDKLFITTERRDPKHILIYDPQKRGYTSR